MYQQTDIVSSVSLLIRSSIESDAATAYLLCRPLSRSPPRDLPGLSQMATEFWSACLVVRAHRTSTLHEMTSWFKIPQQNIVETTGRQPQGELLLCLEDYPMPSLQALLRETKPILQIDGSLDQETLAWLSSQN